MTHMRKRLSIAILLLLLVACGRDNRTEEATQEATAVPPASQSAAATAVPAAPVEATAQPAAPLAEVTAAPEVAQPAAPAGDIAAVVANAMAAQVASGPYRATTVVNSDGTVTEMISEVVPPRNMHVVIGGGNMEVILLEGVVWSKMGGASWVQMGSPEMMQGIFDTVNGQISGTTLTNVQFVGSEPVLGEATDVYSFTSALADGSFTSDVKLWISTATGLPVRMESTSVAAGVTTTAVQTIEYDSSITIEAPTP